MQQNNVRRGRGRAQEWRWARPADDSGWPLRLRFVCIAVAFAFCTWAGLRAVSGRISFGWVAPIQQQTQALVAPLRGSSRGTSFPTVGSTRGQLGQGLVTAQPVPTATALPAVAGSTASTPVSSAASTVTGAPTAATHALVMVATPAARSSVASPARASATVGTEATAPSSATVGADLATGPHTIYVVHAGDTLYGIARRFGVSANLLADFNHLAPPYRIFEGRRLLIPVA